MPTTLHLNDNNIVIQAGDQTHRSQGFAWLKKGEVYFDLNAQHNAVENCRIAPQQINNRYWLQCEQSTIPPNKSGMRHSADLIWRHLSELTKAFQLTEVVLVVPSHYQTANLQLLLGVAQTCGLKVVGLVNKAIWELADQVDQPGSYLHIDIQLHQTVCSIVSLQDGELSLSAVDVVQQISLQAIQDSLLKAIQHSFIQNDRFDPLHHAETEQQLFNQLPAFAEQLLQQKIINIQLDYQGSQHSSSVDSLQWFDAIDSFKQQLDTILQNNAEMITSASASLSNSDPAGRVFLSSNGFQALQLGPTVTLLGDPASRSYAELFGSNDDNAELDYDCSVAIKDRPFEEPNQSTQEACATLPKEAGAGKRSAGAQLNSTAERATHLLQAGIAVPLQTACISWSDNQLMLHRDDTPNLTQLLTSGKLFVVGDAARTSLLPNDRLGSNLADGVITVVQVLG